MSDMNAVREWIVSRVTEIADNDQDWYNRLTEAAQGAVLTDMGTGTTLEGYRLMWDGKRGDYDRSEYVTAVGRAVVEVLREILDEELPDGTTSKGIVADVLDLADSAQADLFGEHYLPNPDDITDPNACADCLVSLDEHCQECQECSCSCDEGDEGDEGDPDDIAE